MSLVVTRTARERNDQRLRRLSRFDAATERQRARDSVWRTRRTLGATWSRYQPTRDELHQR